MAVPAPQATTTLDAIFPATVAMMDGKVVYPKVLYSTGPGSTL